MSSIKKYEEIIKSIPVRNHSVIVRKENWIKNDSLHTRLTKNNQFQNNNDDLLNTLKAIFENAQNGQNGQIEISREDIFKEKDREKKLIMVLLWGYPTGGRGNNIADILYSRNELIPRISDFIENNEKKINSKVFKNLFYTQNKNGEKGEKIKGIGLSTMSKILYFFEIKIDNNPCLIYDSQIHLSLQRNQIDEFYDYPWKKNYASFFHYLEVINKCSEEIKTEPEAIELFLFHYNMHFKLEKK